MITDTYVGASHTLSKKTEKEGASSGRVPLIQKKLHPPRPETGASDARTSLRSHACRRTVDVNCLWTWERLIASLSSGICGCFSPRTSPLVSSVRRAMEIACGEEEFSLASILSTRPSSTVVNSALSNAAPASRRSVAVCSAHKPVLSSCDGPTSCIPIRWGEGGHSSKATIDGSRCKAASVDFPPPADEVRAKALNRCLRRVRFNPYS